MYFDIYERMQLCKLTRNDGTEIYEIRFEKDGKTPA